jgi:radical SAM superfamily enzyme YgiQ (UPF0313 family)
MNITLVCHKYGVPLNDPCCYPLGFMYVSASLKQQGHKVKVLNYNLWDYDLKEELKNQDAVMFTGFEEFKGRIIRDSVVAKELGVKVIIGGALATFCTEEMKQYADFVCVGEFEQCGIDQIPWPDYEGFGVDEYHKKHEFVYMGILTSRGCTRSCTFCAHTCKFRLRDLEDVFKEIDYYQQVYNPEMLVFYDNTLNVNKKRWMRLCQGMADRSLPWCMAMRVDKFDEDMTKAAKDSGCQYAVVGVESFKQSKLDRMQKGISVEQIHSTLELLHKYSIDYHGNILVGFDDETYDDIREEVRNIPKGYKVFPAMLMPFIGTKEGRDRKITEEQFNKLNTEFREYAENYKKVCLPEVGGMNFAT